MEVNINELTWDIIRKMPLEDYKNLIATSEGALKVDAILAEREAAKEAVKEAEKAAIIAAVPEEVVLTPEEEIKAAEAEAAIEVAKAEEARQAEEVRLAEEARQAEAKIELAKSEEAAKEAARPKKFVLDYQATDEQGNAIGNKTHLEAPTQEELLEKVKQAHINIVRAYTRLKNQKVTFKKEEPVLQVSEAELEAAAKDLKSDDPVKQIAAVRKLTNQEEVEKERAQATIEKENARQAQQSYAFMRNHLEDFNPCEANAKVLADYIKSNDLEWTVDNLEVAFANTESQLAPPVKKESLISAPPVANTSVSSQPTAAEAVVVPPVVAAPETPAVVPATATVAAVAAPNTPPAPVRRPGVNAGIIPGSTLTGTRPVVKPPELTKKDIAKMTPTEMRRRQKIDPTFYDKVNALFAKK